jgi:hypothetical protein
MQDLAGRSNQGASGAASSLCGPEQLIERQRRRDIHYRWIFQQNTVTSSIQDKRI